MHRAKHKTSMGLPGGTSDTQPKVEDAPTPPLTAINGGREAVTQEGKRFGWIVAVRRTELGLSQSDLAERMHTSRSEVARIEAGQSPSAETLKRLAAILDGEPGEHGPVRSIARTGAIGSGAGTPRDPLVRREPREPLNRRWLWAGLAAAVLIGLLVITGGRLSGGDDGASPTQSLEAVSALPAVLATVEQAREQVQAQVRAAKAAAQEAKQARAEAILAERREAAAAREEEQAALAESDEESSEFIPEPASAPVYSPPPAPSGGGSNGGGSQAPSDVGHGIGGGG